ncbi:polyisoprenoid-binding protein [Denitratisoma sp. DHT3]|uniref:YceI family protein n=1 Tax=Denitratisoma sp. DHT3 TaxID=1981880 RepID=UPI00119853DA|nr:YceI family protein [Denitratisoma sp. DHT3]QDX80282.1 polyisoprenoid-binding protein [Denitratisoma sp. DHT3]
MNKILTGLLLACALAASAGAVEYNAVQTDKSRIDFVFRQMNVPVDGRFKKFTSTLAFDPARPEAAKVGLTIELASIDTGSKEADDEAIGKQWFNVKAFPTASFVSSRVRSLSKDRYEVGGTLTIKGKSREIVTPVSVKTDASGAVFEGGFNLKRADYGIGEGPWADFDTVGNEIQIKFRVVAASTTPRK